MLINVSPNFVTSQPLCPMLMQHGLFFLIRSGQRVSSETGKPKGQGKKRGDRLHWQVKGKE